LGAENVKFVLHIFSEIVAECLEQWLDQMLFRVRFRINSVNSFASQFLRAFNQFMKALRELRMHLSTLG
jgi:hypothetical protein